MPNFSPIFTLTPRVTGVRLTAANTSSSGSGTIGTDMYLAYSPGVDGAYLQKIRFSLAESVINTASSGAVVRAYISTLSAGATSAADTFLIQELGIPSQQPAATSAGYPIEIPLNFAIPSNRYLLVSTSVAPVANTVWVATTYAGDY